MSAITCPFDADPSAVLMDASVDGVSALDAGGSFRTRANNYLLTVPDTHDAAVRASIKAKPAMPDAAEMEKDNAWKQMPQWGRKLLLALQRDVLVLQGNLTATEADARKVLKGRL